MNAIAARRLQNQHLAGKGLATPAAVVAWFGAMQAQDYRGALWAVAQRTPGATEADVESALADGSIIRTWPMRGTIHIVARADVRWMLDLLAPRVIARSAGRLRELELDANTFARAERVLRDALAGGGQLERAEAYAALERGGVSPAGQRGIHILGHLAIARVLCSGAPRGKQQTFALLDDWVPATAPRERDDALAELARRYITSHGPATVDDFAWWSGLARTEAARAIDIAELRARAIAGRAYFDSSARARAAGSSLHLLPAYDEYTVAYRDRTAVLAPANAARLKNGIFAPVIVRDGQIAGTWGRSIARGKVALTAQPIAPLDHTTHKTLEREAERYGTFLGLPVTLTVATAARAKR